jgi:predicted dehydrogenase
MKKNTSRRNFIKSVSAGAAVMSIDAASYARIPGANSRISIAIIGCGRRGVGAHMKSIHPYAESENIAVTAVCDPWRQRREAAAALTKEQYGSKARQFVSYRDVLASDDIDAVMIASCDHQHTTHLTAAAAAKKHAYCEKPLAKDMASLRECVDAVEASGIVCQMGTQGRSRAGATGCREFYKSGALGKITRIEQRRNGSKPYWYSRVEEANKADVEWSEFLMDAPDRPFDPVLFTGWMGFREFSDGPVPQLAAHYLDMIHYVTGAKAPESCVAQSAIFTWKDEHAFTAPDEVESTWIYPEGFLVSYTTGYGNSSGKSYRFFGSRGTIDMGGDAPIASGEGAIDRENRIENRKGVKPVETTEHFLNWLQCLRTGKTPNADIDAGYSHSVASIMSVLAMDTGQRQIHDPATREIVAG